MNTNTNNYNDLNDKIDELITILFNEEQNVSQDDQLFTRQRFKENFLEDETRSPNSYASSFVYSWIM